jgi:uncharacterized protein YggE
MKKHIYLILLLCAFTLTAQHRGNYNQQEISRANIASSMGNATVYNPSINGPIHKTLNPSNYLTIEVKGLQNVKATSYTAVFNLSQIGETAEITNQLAKERIDAVKAALMSQGILENDFVIDVISFVPVYEIQVEKKIFSKKYNEVPKGFELQQNIHIRFTKTKQFENILTACAKNEIYNLVKVDYYIEDVAAVYKNLQEKLITLIEEKKDYYGLLGFDIANYDVAVADDKYCHFPKDFYQSYQAYNSISFEAIKQNKGVTEAKKQTSFYYEPLSYGQYDVVINGAILEPVVQMGMHIKLLYTKKPEKAAPKPEVKIETKHKYYVVSPDGKIDVKELQTN